MARVIGSGCGAAIVGSFVTTFVGALVLTVGHLFDDPFWLPGIVPFSLITMFFTIPGAAIVLALARLFERRGAKGARLLLAVLASGAVVGGGLLTLFALFIYLTSGNALYLDVRVSALGAFYGIVTAAALWAFEAPARGSHRRSPPSS